MPKGEQVRPEYVVAAVGRVRLRGADAVNPKMPTGEIEIEATELRVLNDARLAPFSPADEAIQNEEVRLKYRYVDLRRAEMQRNFRLRHDITLAIRESMSKQGFLEVETPILCKSTPEGARDFLVPSRVHAGEFYALPQSAADLQADSDDLRVRPLFPDCALLSRRGFAGRPAA